MAQYNYNRYPPVANKRTMEEASNPPGHRYGYVKRRDRAVSGPAGASYAAFCLCGWKEPKGKYHSQRKHAALEFQFHIQEVRKQLRMFDEVGQTGIAYLIVLGFIVAIMAMVLLTVTIYAYGMWLYFGAIGLIGYKLYLRRYRMVTPKRPIIEAKWRKTDG